MAFTDRWGQLLLYAVAPSQVQLVSRTQLPVAAAVDDLAWQRDGDVLAHNTAGWWTVPGCPNCLDPDSAMDMLVARLSTAGCWTERQLTDIDDEVRSMLGLTVCRYDPPAVGEN